MSYITPNTTVKLLKGVPLDSRYDETVYFDSLELQEAQFNTYDSIVFNNQTYQRVNKNKIRLQINAESVYAYNYMMFKNTAYGNKWFYAFITDIEYINDNTTEITYELDVMQTWFFDYELEPSYVERETTETDNIGENIAPEPIDLGPIACYSIIDTGFFNSYRAVVCSAERDVPVPFLPGTNV